MFLPKEGNEMSKSTENSTCQTPFAYDYGFVKETCVRTSCPKERIRLCSRITPVPSKDSWSRQLWSSNERTGKKTKATSDTYKLYLLNNAWRIQIGYGRGFGGNAFSMDNQTDKDCIIRRVWHTKKEKKKGKKKSPSTRTHFEIDCQIISHLYLKQTDIMLTACWSSEMPPTNQSTCGILSPSCKSCTRLPRCLTRKCILKRWVRLEIQCGVVQTECAHWAGKQRCLLLSLAVTQRCSLPPVPDGRGSLPTERHVRLPHVIVSPSAFRE